MNICIRKCAIWIRNKKIQAGHFVSNPFCKFRANSSQVTRMFPDRSFLQTSTRFEFSRASQAKLLSAKAEDFHHNSILRRKFSRTEEIVIICRTFASWKVAWKWENFFNFLPTIISNQVANLFLDFHFFSVQSNKLTNEKLSFGKNQSQSRISRLVLHSGVVVHPDPNFLYFPNRIFCICISTISISKFIEGWKKSNQKKIWEGKLF